MKEAPLESDRPRRTPPRKMACPALSLGRRDGDCWRFGWSSILFLSFMTLLVDAGKTFAGDGDGVGGGIV